MKSIVPDFLNVSGVRQVELTVADPARPGEKVEVTYRGERFVGRVTGGISEFPGIGRSGKHTAVADLALCTDLPSTPEEQKRRTDRADELLSRLVDDIGSGPAFDRLRKDVQRVKNVLRGLDW